jgi:hypothetical protein
MKIFKNSPLNRNQRKRLVRLRRRATNRRLVAEVNHRLQWTLCGQRDSLLRDLPIAHLDLQQPGEKAAFSMSSPKANAVQRALAHCSLFCREGHRLIHQTRQTGSCPALKAAFAFSEKKEIK